MSQNQMQINPMVPLTPVVKGLLIANVSIWLIFQVIVERYILSSDHPMAFTYTFGLVPLRVLEQGYVWQIFTYMFLHSDNVFHILFNMLMLWWLGAELELRWGSKFFALFYVLSGVGAAIIYLIGLGVNYAFTGNMAGWAHHVVGASGALFGIMVAYGILFGHRIFYFMMLFPMPAKYFVMILAAVEVVTILNSGVGGSGVANLAHLGGLISGFIILKAFTFFQQRRWRAASSKRGRNLHLVVSNENDKKDGSGGSDDSGGPKFWN